MPYIFSLSCFIHFIHLSWISFLTIIGKVYHLSLPLSFLTKDKSSWFSFILTALKLIVHNWFVKSDTDKVCFLCFFFLATLHGLENHSSLLRDWIWAPCSGGWSPTQWTTGEVPLTMFRNTVGGYIPYTLLILLENLQQLHLKEKNVLVTSKDFSEKSH